MAPFRLNLKATLGMVALIGFQSGCATIYTSWSEYDYQEVFYLTTRENVQSQQPNEWFGGDRGKLQYGVAMVARDPDDALSRFYRPQANKVLQQLNLLKPQAVQQVIRFSKDEFIEGIGKYAASVEGAREVLIYIHGYRRTFEQNLENAAQLRYELAFTGPVIAFSWPSTNKMSGYLADIENLDWSEPQLEDLLDQISHEFPGTRIHIIAHSLGNRALINTLVDYQRRDAAEKTWSFGELVFLAPDIDRDRFLNDLATVLTEIPARKTLYVSSFDFPLMASAQVHEYPRLGDSRTGAPIIDGFETIDVTDAITILNGHGYYEENRETIEDLHYLICERKGAADRPTLESVDSGNGTYWNLVTSEE